MPDITTLFDTRRASMVTPNLKFSTKFAENCRIIKKKFASFGYFLVIIHVLYAVLIHSSIKRGKFRVEWINT
jgi:cytochrome b561